MNFIPIKSKIIIIILLLLLSSNNNSVYCSSDIPVKTGIPLIQNFPFPNFFLSSGKFSVYEDPTGFFIIGAKNKIIVFYGNEFLSFPLKGQITISSTSKSVLYCGYNSVGLIRLFNNSQPQIIPIVDEKLGNAENIGQINNVIYFNEQIIFNNNKKLFQFDGTRISLLDSSNIALQLFSIDNELYVYKKESGLYKYTNKQVAPIAFGNAIAGKNIDCILPYKGNLLIKLTGEAEFNILSPNGLKHIPFGFEEYLSKAGFSDATILRNGKIAIGTKSAGIIIFDPATQSTQFIGVGQGLLANATNNLHVDLAGNLWALHDFGLSRIELNVPVTVFGQFAGISGKVNDILNYHESIFIATSNGLFKSNSAALVHPKSNKQLYFNQVEGIINECIKLKTINNILNIVTPTGIYQLQSDRLKRVVNEDIKCCDFTSKGFACIGNSEGIKIFDLKNANRPMVSDSLFGLSALEIAVEKNDIVWIKTTENNLIYANTNNLSATLKQINDKQFTSTSNANFHLLKTETGVKFCYPDAILKYSIEASKFEHESISDRKYLNGIPWLVEVQTDAKNNRWYHISSSIENLQGILLYKIYNENKAKPFFFNTGSIFSPIFFDTNYVYIGGDSKLLRFDNNSTFNFPRDFSAIIKRIFIGNDSLLQVGLDDPEISNHYNSIKFLISSTCFEGEPYVRYQYKLIGHNTEWSGWSRESTISFNNLSAGSYTFQIRALNVDGIISDITELTFYIKHPFYLTIPAYLMYLLCALFLIFIFLRWRTWSFIKYKDTLEKIVQERTEEILKEKEKSEILIANMLPKGTADELKSTGKATSQKFAMATVLFSDIQGFTKIAEQMNPDLLIDQLDAFFFHFDSVVEKYNIEKIKTIGDAYMCAGGIPHKNITNPVEVVLAALEMQEYMRQLKIQNADIWDLRIGIHTGSVIAGVVGHKKLSYDIWGDTVNTASRMESSGEAGKVNISGHTFDLVNDFFVCEYRGKMPVKYKGEIDMYFVKSIRPELAIDMRHVPNKKFLVMLQLLRLQDLEDEVFEKLEKEHPSTLHFHNLQRIRDVYNLVDLFSRAEELNDEENLIVRSAALLQDVGYIWTYDNHEDKSIEYARKVLPEFKFTDDQIHKIIELIEAAKRLRKPHNKLEEILLDADMNYLSRADFVTLNEDYFSELLIKDKAQSKDEWNNMQIVLLSNHKYYTSVANVLRDVSPEQQIENLIKSSEKTKP